jgi:hypothetical protein
MEEFVARKRVSIYLVLICWGMAAAMGQPGIHLMIEGTILLFLLFLLRFIAHFEGQYMLKAAEAAHESKIVARGAVFRHLAVEFAIAVGIFMIFATVLYLLVQHVPWLWFPSH